MRQNRCRQATWIAFSTALLLSHAGPAFAQVDEARKTNWDNAKRLYPMIVDAVAAKNGDEVYARTDEFRLNLDYIQDKLEHVGDHLHDKDKNWGWSSKKSLALDRVRRTKVAAGILGSKAREAGASMDSELGAFQSEWKDFGDAFDDLWKEYITHAREQAEVMKAFHEDCRECTP